MIATQMATATREITMTALTTHFPAALRDPGTAEGRYSDYERRMARDAEERFFVQHGAAGPLFLYRLVAALS